MTLRLRLAYLSLGLLMCASTHAALAAPDGIQCSHNTRGIAANFLKVSDSEFKITLSDRFAGSTLSKLAIFARTLGLIEEGPWAGQLTVTMPPDRCHFSADQRLLITCNSLFLPITIKAGDFEGNVTREVQVGRFIASISHVERTSATSQGNHVYVNEEVSVEVQGGQQAELQFVPVSSCQATN